ncbi:MAG TPA: phospholipase D-like domain-containing protein [Gemmatimonadales bacterium]
MPADAAGYVGSDFSRHFYDLRTTVRTLVAEASKRVILAAPYWDEQVASDLADLLERRLRAGVRVAVLARRPQAGTTNERALAILRAALADSPGSEVRILERASKVDPFGASTFHFKVACADSRRAYLGSANFNTAGLNSRWELGVLLGPRNAGVLAQCLEGLWSAASAQ